MNEEEVIEQLKGIDYVFSLPCDKNKRLTDMLHSSFETVDITREEDAVGMSAGTALLGKKSIVSIQSSGLGNMLNALMSLTDCYKLPMFVLASWRGTESEKIEAQIPFNSRIPELLKVYGIGCDIVENKDDVVKIGKSLNNAFENSKINVVLIKPELWGNSKRLETEYPSRKHKKIDVPYSEFPEPTLTRLDAIREIVKCTNENDIIISNIGVPSKETYAAGDRNLNFYMLGSYTQATPIGFGMSLCTDRKVIVIDGDGSLMGSSFFPVLSATNRDNLTVVCLDNGTFGSTGNQVDHAYSSVDLYMVAKAYGLPCVERACNSAEIEKAFTNNKCMKFIHVPIKPFNSDSPNIPLSAENIKKRFMQYV